VGRIAGVSADQTRQRLLGSAARVFADKGYDGASIGELTAEAGLSRGALYAHFGSKADLFAATLRSHGSAEVEQLLTLGGPGSEAVAILRERGIALARRRRQQGSLLVEAIVAARRHPEVAAVLTDALTEREERFADLVRAGQSDGSIEPRLAPEAAARFVLMLVLGSLLVAAVDLPDVDDDAWAELVGDLVARFGATLTAS
jgi:AcrR family transcriptional regulator